MKTSIDVLKAATPGYEIKVTRTDGEVLTLHFGSLKGVVEASFFLIEAFTQERLSAIEETGQRAMAALDKLG